MKQWHRVSNSGSHQFRLDGGNDATDTLRVLQKSGHFFLVTRNLRRDSSLFWLDVVKSMGEKASYETCEGKTVCIGTYTKTKNSLASTGGGSPVKTGS